MRFGLKIRWVFLLTVSLVAILQIFPAGFWLGRVVYPVYWRYQTRDYQTAERQDFEMRISPSSSGYLPGQEKYVSMVREYFACSVSAPLVILLSKDELTQALGGGAGAGAYQSGVILLGMGENQDELEGAMLHELSHYYVDTIARGNYPLWYSEGLAQLIELKNLGRLWFDGKKDKVYYRYSITELSGDFYSLEDQVSAYRMALDVVLAIEAASGQANQLILRDLGRGSSFAEAVQAHTGLSPEDLYNYVNSKGQ